MASSSFAPALSKFGDVLVGDDEASSAPPADEESLLLLSDNNMNKGSRRRQQLNFQQQSRSPFSWMSAIVFVTSAIVLSLMYGYRANFHLQRTPQGNHQQQHLLSSKLKTPKNKQDATPQMNDGSTYTGTNCRYRARYVFKIPVWDRQPNWNNIITSKEQEKDLKAFTCKTCGSTLFIAKTREFFFEGSTGIGGLGCFSCGAKGKDNFVQDRDRIVEDVADIDDYFDYERPLDYVSAAERRKLMKEAGGDEDKANEILAARSVEENTGGGEIVDAEVITPDANAEAVTEGSEDSSDLLDDVKEETKEESKPLEASTEQEETEEPKATKKPKKKKAKKQPPPPPEDIDDFADVLGLDDL